MRLALQCNSRSARRRRVCDVGAAMARRRPGCVRAILQHVHFIACASVRSDSPSAFGASAPRAAAAGCRLASMCARCAWIVRNTNSRRRVDSLGPSMRDTNPSRTVTSAICCAAFADASERCDPKPSQGVAALCKRWHVKCSLCAVQDPSNSVEFQAQARNMQEHFDLLHQAIVSVRTSMSASRSHVNSSNAIDVQSRCSRDQNSHSLAS